MIRPSFREWQLGRLPEPYATRCAIHHATRDLFAVSAALRGLGEAAASAVLAIQEAGERWHVEPAQ